ncbi:1-acyl-sn-glycerol-3-phosphate acyltransferase [Synechococcus sp. PCC 7336]|uniref:lysophospholipid acyltransferase family protein n=1 Tax=Synechococcus sp. PCC 7336 TaxID=195250 RepID=UPI000373EF39|nr:lysophospholipid acyltransferase family protein [Synechococcus sp. PCC 7336]
MPRQREPFHNLVLYHLFKWLVVSPTLHIIYRGRIYGADRVPKQGPLVVVSNHASLFDPPFLSNCVGRPVAFMAKAELFNVPVLKQAIRLYGAYPVRRGGADRRALLAARQALDNGWAVGIFLNGTRSTDGRIHKPYLGAAAIAAKARVPMLPVALWGTQNILPQGKRLPRGCTPVTVRIGRVLPPPASGDRADLQATAQACTDAIHALLDLGR